MKKFWKFKIAFTLILRPTKCRDGPEVTFSTLKRAIVYLATTHHLIISFSRGLSSNALLSHRTALTGGFA